MTVASRYFILQGKDHLLRPVRLEEREESRGEDKRHILEESNRV